MGRGGESPGRAHGDGCSVMRMRPARPRDPSFKGIDERDPRPEDA